MNYTCPLCKSILTEKSPLYKVYKTYNLFCSDEDHDYGIDKDSYHPSFFVRTGEYTLHSYANTICIHYNKVDELMDFPGNFKLIPVHLSLDAILSTINKLKMLS